MRELHIEPGPAVGLALDTLLAAVTDGDMPNDRAVLLSYLHDRI